MDLRTASALCAVDLMPLIEAGDFRALPAGKALIDKLSASAPNDKDRAILLHQLGDDLADIRADKPECDAFLRAIRATARLLERQSVANGMGLRLVTDSRR